MTGAFSHPLLAAGAPLSKSVAGLLSVLLVAVGLVVVALQGPAVAASPGAVELTTQVAPRVLAGESTTVNLTATNAGGEDLYNATFRYVLPVGVSYVPGSTTGPDALSAPEPRVLTVTTGITPDVKTHQVLIWDNVSDLVVGAATSLIFEVQPDPALHPVGSSFTGEATAFASADERKVAKFDAQGRADAATGSLPQDSAAGLVTQVSALKVTKSEPSPEAELMRGVHTQQTVYTITVENTDQGPTGGVEVVDYLPAGLEFLGCAGGGDNTTTGDEYPNASALIVAEDGGSCAVPASVETVELDGAVFTKVTWTGLALAPGETRTLTYAAAIPLFANTMVWPGVVPEKEDGQQGRNLDNNTGPSTRQTSSGAGLTNTVEARGTYQGLVASQTDREASDSDTTTVKAMDLSVVKSAVGTPSFVSDGTATFTLSVRTSEYTSAADMVIKDTIPNGMCPLVASAADITNTTGKPLPRGCATAGVPPIGADVDDVAFNADGSFTITFIPDPTMLGVNATHTITYTAAMGANYDGATTDPTVAGDSFVNEVTIEGTTTDVTGRQTGETAVTDDSSARLATDGPKISKKVAARPATGTTSTPATCLSQAYVSASDPLPAYQRGDYVCFELTVAFSTSTQTRNAAIVDFVPPGTTYKGFAVDPAQTTVVTALDGTEAKDPAGQNLKPAAWRLGTTTDNTSWFVDKGATATIYVLVEITDSLNPLGIDITGNLMKYRQESTSGSVLALRSQADFEIGADPAVTLTKAVAEVNGVAAPAPPAQVMVKQRDVVQYAVTLTNTGTPELRNDVPVNDLVVWDALPAGYTCAQWTFQSTGPLTGTCLDPADAGYPANTAQPAGRSLITWTVPGPVAAGASQALTYTLTVPDGVSVSTAHTNTASLVKFTSPTTSGTDAVYRPKGSLDSSVTAPNAPTANADAEIVVPGAVVAKKVTRTSVDAINNTALTQVVAGEHVDYEYAVTIPARTTVYNATLSDALPSGLSAVVGTAASARLDTASPLPSGVALSADPAVAGFGTLSFSDSYTNATATDQVFTVTVSNLLVGVTLTSGSLTNTATFASKATLDGTDLPPRTATASTTVVVPVPTLTKTATPETIGADGTVEFTIEVANTPGAPLAYDRVVVDCVPAGLFVESTSGVLPTIGTCSDGMLLTWTLPNLPDPAAPVVLKYTARLSPDAAGSSSYANTATVTGSTLANGVNDEAVEKVVTATDTAVVNVAPAVVDKTVAPESAPIGDEVTYTVAVTLPANVNFFRPTIVDVLPAGVTLVPDSTTFSCVVADGATCAEPTGLTGPTTSGQTVTWAMGAKIPALTQERVVTLTYRATLTNSTSTPVPAKATNTAQMKWFTDATIPGTEVGSNEDTAVVTVLRPTLSIVKKVNGLDAVTVDPGSPLTYTLKVTNANTLTTSAAHNVTVVDKLPVGIVLDEASLTGGAYDAATRTITWTIPAIAKNASVDLTYSARPAASGLIGATGLVNTANIPTYHSAATGGREYTGPADTATVTPRFPMMTAAKKATSAPAVVAYRGTSFGWTITGTNTGAGLAQTVTLTDTLPASWTYDAGSARVVVAGTSIGQVEPVVVSGVLTWTFTPASPATSLLTQGQAITVAYTATPGASAAVGSAFHHTNTVKAAATDLTGADRNASRVYESTPATAFAEIHSADLVLTKTAATSVTAGTSGTGWSITVRNQGPDTSTGPLLVADTPTLPAGVTVTQAAGSGWVCTVPSSTGAFECTRAGSLASGATTPAITVTVTVDAGVLHGTRVPNTATVSTTGTHDPTPGNNTGTSELPVTAAADLSLVKTLNTATVQAGDWVSWTLQPSNNGPSTSQKTVTVMDTVPAGVSDATATAGPDWTCAPASADAGDTITCTYAANDGVMPLGMAGPITVTGLVDPSRTTAITNTATITAGTTTDPAPGNNTATVTATPSTGTTIWAQKSIASPDPLVSGIVPGQDAVYEISVTNTGLADARGVRITDTLPAGLTFKSAAGTDWSCSSAAGATTVDCALNRTLAAGSVGAVTTLRVTVATDPALDPDGPLIINNVTAEADNAPPSTDSTESDPDGKSDLSVVKSHATGEILAGATLDYALAVTNHGPTSISAGTTTTVVDTVPSELTVTSATGVGWSCVVGAQTPTGTEVTCDSTRLLATGGDAPVITVTVEVPTDLSAQTLTNVARVAGPLDDPTPANNTTTDPTVITTRADLSIDKTLVAGQTPVAGSPVDYLLTVVNDGPSAARDVQVVDLVPVGMTVTSISGAGWVCAADSCAYSGLLNPGTYALTLTATVDQGVPDGTLLTNVAELTWTDGDGAHRTTDPADVLVAALADLGLVKTAVDDQGAEITDVLAGTRGYYSLVVTNHGPSAAVAPLTVVDQLPVGVAYLGVTDPAWTCAAGPIDGNGQTVTCTTSQTSAPLPSGGSAAPLTLVVQYDAGLPAGDFTNTATVSSPTDEGANLMPNTDTAVVTVQPDPAVTLDKLVALDAGRTGALADTLTYTFTVRNTGNVTLTDVAIADPMPGLTALTYGPWPDPAAAGVLLQGESVEATATLVLAQEHVDAGTVVNTATVEGTSPQRVVVTDPGDAVIPLPQAPSIALLKSGGMDSGALGVAGDRVGYTFEVANTGDVTLHDVTIVDALEGLSEVTFDGWPSGPGTLAPGEVVTASATYILTQADVDAGQVTNVATATGTPQVGQPVSDDATVTVDATQRTGIDLVKTGAIDGSSAEFAFTVTNTGTVTLTGVSIADALPGLSEVQYGTWPTMAGTLAPGQSVTASATLALTAAHVAAGSITNTATVTGVPPTGGAVTATDEVTLTVPPSTAGVLPNTSGVLPWTGAAVGGLALLALGLVAGGLLLVRRRPHRQH